MDSIMNLVVTFGGWVFAGLIVTMAIRSAFFTVDHQTRRVVTCFGKFARVASPGPNFKWPLIESVSGPISLRVTQLTLSELTYTDKGTSVTIEANIQYVVGEDDQSVSLAFYKLTDPGPQIRSHVASSIRGVVPKMTLESVQANQADIANHVKEELIHTMQQYGYKITDVLVTKADPNKSVVDANNEKYASEQAKVTAENLAAANYTRVVQSAKADAEAMKAHGQGVAGEREAIVKGLQQSVKEFELAVEGTTAKDAMALLAYQQYLETLSKLAQSGQSKVIFVPSGAGASSEVMTQIRNALVAGNEAAKSDTADE